MGEDRWRGMYSVLSAHSFAFAISGAIIAMEEEYDLFGVYILGVVTASGGGAIRNFLIGFPTSA